MIDSLDSATNMFLIRTNFEHGFENLLPVETDQLPKFSFPGIPQVIIDFSNGFSMSTSYCEPPMAIGFPRRPCDGDAFLLCQVRKAGLEKMDVSNIQSEKSDT